jgi:GT2 family glycosyltransferase
MTTQPLVSIVIVGWNSRADLAGCLPTLEAQTYAPFEIIVVDNASTDGTARWLGEAYPHIRLLRNARNRGFAYATNQGFAIARGDILIGLNPDTQVSPDWLFPLVEAVYRPGVGLVTPRIMLVQDRTRLNAYGNQISLTGITSCLGLGELATDYQGAQSVPAISGAAFAITRSRYEELGAFDPDYFTYYEDTELSWRVRLAGYDIVAVGQSVIYHNYTPTLSPAKLYWLERNRWWTLLKHLAPFTWLRLAPVLLLGELLIWGYAAMQGPAMVQAKIQAYHALWHHRNRIRGSRRSVKSLRRTDDDAVLRWLTSAFPLEQVTGHASLRYGLHIMTKCFLVWQRIAFLPIRVRQGTRQSVMESRYYSAVE